ncbi:MAG: carboxypeptidase-like regulatory domain-containing protein [Bryobacteraceae bacterium]|nr:carboxypeptidase-like regulatory domain-containing protein [Bryobacteraceae bacterium]MDW8379098.1 carboxypeptidase-like regulatory domain-containing protein [Bryobacterales bacterium]
MSKLLWLVFLVAPAIQAQTTFASITGNITDQTGAVVSGAKVTAVHLESNYSYTSVSNDAGNYTLAQLREGVYSLRVKMDGFKEVFIPRIELVSLDVRRIDIKLEVGSVDTKVEVRAEGALIETETARISDSKSAMQLKVLPLNTRSLWNFIGLSPGVVQAGAGSANRRFSGSRLNQSDASIDGITISNGWDGTQISPLVSQIESFQEVRIDMANNTAEFGAIGQVTIVSKGGTNELHGVGFDYYSTPWFRSRNPFAAQRGTGVRHEPGAAIGGPIYLPKLYNGRNKTFFFYSFETSRGSQVLQLLDPTVAPPSWRGGDFSRLAPGTVVRDPFANNAPFSGNIIPASRISSVSRRIQERFFPLPNQPDPETFRAQNYREQLSRPFDPNTYWTSRIDHRFNDRHFIFGRYTWNRSHSREYEGNLPAIGRRWQTRDTRALNLSYTATLRSNLINEFRWGYAYNNNPRNGPLMGQEVVRDLGITGLLDNLPNINGLFRVSFAGIGLTGLSQTDWRHPGFENNAQQYQNYLSWFRSKHNIKLGAVLNRTQFRDRNMPTALFGSVNFSNRFTGHPYADFLLGIPTTASRQAPAILVDRLRNAWDFFITDEYKVTPKLTLNLGLRYEIKPAWSEANDRQAVFDIVAGKIVVPDGALNQISPLMPRDYVEIVEASSLGYHSRLLLRNDWTNWAPRFGLAWRPFSNRTVFRTGYGIFYDTITRAAGAGGAPFVVNEPSFTNPTPVPTLLFPRVFPESVAGPTTITLPSGVNPSLRNPYSMQYNVTIEHERWNTGFRASYIGTNTRQGEFGYNANQPVPDGRVFVDKPRPFPRFPAITYITNGAGHQYHALSLEAERRYARGLAWQLSWVWARDIGDLERGESPEDAFDRRRERAVWLDIPTHRVTGNMFWELPFGRGRKWLSGARPLVRALASGWELNAVFSTYSGQFLTPLWTGPDPTGTAFTPNRTPAQVTIRPDHLRNANIADRTVNRWFDVSAFSAPAQGRFGTSAKGVIKGPGSIVLNGGVAKTVSFRERARLRWELTGTNVTNTPNWANPGTNIVQAGQVGVITGVGGVSSLDASGPRALRTGLRLEF